MTHPHITTARNAYPARNPQPTTPLARLDPTRWTPTTPIHADDYATHNTARAARAIPTLQILAHTALTETDIPTLAALTLTTYSAHDTGATPTDLATDLLADVHHLADAHNITLDDTTNPHPTDLAATIHTLTTILRTTHPTYQDIHDTAHRRYLEELTGQATAPLHVSTEHDATTTDADRALRTLVAEHFNGDTAAAMLAVARHGNIAVAYLDRTRFADEFAHHNVTLTDDLWHTITTLPGAFDLDDYIADPGTGAYPDYAACILRQLDIPTNDDD